MHYFYRIPCIKNRKSVIFIPFMPIICEINPLCLDRAARKGYNFTVTYDIWR